MRIRIRIRHETTYSYSQPVQLGPHTIRLRPAGHLRARLLAYNLEVDPAGELRWQDDPWGNRVARLTYTKDEAIERLRLAVDASFDVRPVNPFDFYLDDRCENLPFVYPDGLEPELSQYLETSPPGAQLAEFLAGLPSGGQTIGFLVDLTRHVAERVRYIIRNDPGVQTSEETLTIGSGSCRDSAVLLVDTLRARGLAARFVSGYLVQLTDEGIIPDLPRGVSRDVVDLHAWAEVFVPGAGWIGLDGTSGLLCGEGHIPLACATRPELAAPVTGTADRPASHFEFATEVVRLGHEPSPRRPYSDAQWAAMLEAGDVVDRSLEERALRLTVGAEPTWTSREHPEEPEWNNAAPGATKRAQGVRLWNELRGRFGRGVLGLERMGKWCPGESLPRWGLDLIWRADGVPVWRDATRLDLGGGGHAGDLDRLLATAREFAGELARRLDVDPSIVAGFEDPWHFLLQEDRLPGDVDPLSVDLDDPEERRRLARVLDRGLGREVGFALPLALVQSGWESSPWTFRGGRMLLLPGDSPMGLRLPLDRLEGGRRPEYVEDTTAVDRGLEFDPRTRREVRCGEPETPPGVRHKTVHEEDEEGPHRTALCVEPRDGVLHVFLPPMDACEDFLELVAAVEDVTAELDLRVRIEGYGPPRDPRLRHCTVAPDPGVIEVNIPVTESFRDYVALLETVSDAANHAGLSTEKYQIDGREVGSGGGNHITLGGPTTVESPFVKRPDILASLLRYLQNHPSLSYLFTGLFVGPTSQAPRIDEARHESLYELELALAQIPGPETRVPPWLADRLLRNLLVDVSGNTHRTEVSIDKLYDPAGVAGRLGIVELRAFEMPPHERMAAAQMLLARSLVARLAREPYSAPLVRWGTELHDRFLLPHHLWADFRGVAGDLRRCGLPCEEDWFRPFLEYRFPVMGTLELEDFQLELRLAMEPWLTLGEEPTGATVSRYVDSSIERLEIRARGFADERHVVAVNGWRLPMRPTGTASEAVAGVRFRAWQPPHCLHPNIPVHHPLRFDVVDTWGKRSLGACTYHVWHPEERAFDVPPLTAFEAAARRAQRFTTEGHAPWPVEVKETEPHPEHPYTLDLRRFSVPRPGKETPG